MLKIQPLKFLKKKEVDIVTENKILKASNKRLKIFIALIFVVVAVLGYKQFYVFAQFVVDSFDTDTNIADTWRAEVATSSGVVRVMEKEALNCTTWNCVSSTTCSNDLGDGTYIIIAQSDEAGTKQWKTTKTACDQPQCPNDSYQNYESMVADNTVDFSLYQARNACKSKGGRLPTYNEMTCIYNNRALFGSFAATDYWTGAEEGGVNSAWVRNFSNGAVGTKWKNEYTYVRCVMGW